MEFVKIDDETIEIFPGGLDPEKLLQEMARISYESAEFLIPGYLHPIDVPSSLVDFSEYVSEKGLALAYLNGKRCSTFVKKRAGRLFFDARKFREERGSPELFLRMVQEELMRV
ncbi:MAG: hypothetical protein JRH13_15335 [Deltaproteobacteria bacterium]|nr:hypothetical protein [Deltaproteobacteria bacterium]MBW2017689.1 hypothetical protein [Deltaproteobacteria bacterium]MBW2130722.1 hypothetical protein [Deltaproteobacteria bacterium]MBW2303402.1 hypothetical protein [Deltaproteobacteria bacterium]